MALIDRLHEIIDPLVRDVGVELYDLEVNGGVVKVTVDKDGGVGLTDIAELTREVSRALDVHDPIDGRYTLEVSSPGLERTLRTPAHFAGAVGTSVKLKLRPGVAAERRIEGVIASAGDASIVLRTAAGEQSIALVDIDKARTVFEWGPAPKPGSKPTRPRRTPPAPVTAASPADRAASSVEGAPAVSSESSASSDAVKVVNA